MAQIQFEDILPWGTTGGDTGLSSRLKLKRNFDKIKLLFDQLPDLSGEATAWGRTFWRGGVPVTIPTTDDLTLTGGARLLLGDGVLSWDDVLGVGLWSRGLAALGSVSALGYSAAGGGGDVALGPLLTLLNDEPVPATDGYLHWTGSAFEWAEPGGGGDMPSTVAWNNITGKPATFTPSEHDHDGRYYIDGGTIYLGGNSITPLTAHQSLAGYAKEAYVQQACDSVVSFVASHYVQQESGKGLSANDFTNELLARLNGIEEGANKYVHPTNGANKTIAAAAGRVLSSVTVDTLGHVTAINSKTLAPADIPALTVSKISDFPTTWPWSKITGTPTTLSGYGITDAATAAQMTAATGRLTALESLFDANGVAKSALRLGGNGTYTAWGQTWWQDGVPKGNVNGDLVVIDPNGNNVTDSAKIRFGNIADGQNTHNCPYIQGISIPNQATFGRRRLGFFTTNATTDNTGWVEALSIHPNGNIGINTTEPQQKLHVVGNIMATGAVSALGYSADGGGAAGATYLRELLDVNIGGTPSAGQVLTYRNGYWVAETMQVPTPDLSAYATQAWVQQNWQIKSLSNVYDDGQQAIITGDYVPYDVQVVNGVLTVTYGHLPFQTVYWEDIEDKPDVVTALGVSGDYVTWTREGVTNNLTVPFATRASELKHYAAGNTSPDGIAGTFAWSGSGALRSGYDYVGLQIGDAVDKWQLTVIDHLQWRQNDSGGTNASAWGAWRTLIDSANWQSFISMSSLGVTDALAGYLPLTGGTLTGGVYLKSALAADNYATHFGHSIGLTALLNQHSGSDGGRRGGIHFMYGRESQGSSTDTRDRLNSINIACLSEYKSDYYAGSYGLSITAEALTWKGGAVWHAGNFRANMEYTSWTDFSEFAANVQTNYATKAQLAGYLPLSGGTLTGSLNIVNGSGLYIKDTGGTNRMAVLMNSQNQFFVGYGMRQAGYKGYFDSGILHFRTTSGEVTMLANGNVGIGTTTPTEKLHVIGNVLASGSMSANIAEVSNAAGGLVLMSADTGYLGKLRVFDTSRGADAVSFYAADGSSVRNGVTADFGANLLKIGSGTAGWDYSAGLLKLTGGMYATGAVAALGLSSASGDAVVGSLTATGDLTVSGSVSFEDALDVLSDVFVGDSLYLSGDRTHRLYVENGHLYFNGQLVK